MTTVYKELNWHSDKHFSSYNFIFGTTEGHMFHWGQIWMYVTIPSFTCIFV